MNHPSYNVRDLIAMQEQISRELRQHIRLATSQTADKELRLVESNQAIERLMRAPTLNLNGTSFRQFQHDNASVEGVLELARRAIQDTSLHLRDYDGNGEGYGAAIRERDRRIKVLDDLSTAYAQDFEIVHSQQQARLAAQGR